MLRRRRDQLRRRGEVGPAVGTDSWTMLRTDQWFEEGERPGLQAEAFCIKHHALLVLPLAAEHLQLVVAILFAWLPAKYIAHIWGSEIVVVGAFSTEDA